MAESRTVGHLDVDAFYVAVECMRRPDLRGRPVVVAGSGPRAVVTTASYEARRHGVGSAMPAARARRLCPEAIFIEPDFGHYRAVSAQLMAIVRASVDVVEVVSLDEAYVDLSGFSFPRALMRRLVAQIRAETGLDCSVGIGPNKLVAKVASDAEKPQGFVVLSRREACRRFAGAAPGLIPGIGPKTAARLLALGIGTIGQLADADEAVLTERFGANLGRDIRRRAQFRHDGAVTPVRERVSESRERTFDSDVADAERLAHSLERMASDLCASLAAHGRRGRTIAIKVRLDDFTTVTRARTIAAPTCEAGVVADIATRLLREYAPPRPVRLLGVRVGALEPQSDAPPAVERAAASVAAQMALPL